MLNLILEIGGEITRYTLTPGESTVDRAPASDIWIDDRSISRHHARFLVTDDRCVLSDLDSRNGTYRNDELVVECEVTDGDRLTFGSVPVRVEQSIDERLALSDNHSLFDASATVYRTVGPAAATTDVRPSGPSGPITVDVQKLMGLLSEIAKTLVSLQPLTEVLGRVVDLTFDCIPAERVFLLLNDDATGALVARASRCRDGTVPERATISRTVANMVMTDRVAMLATDAQLDARLSSAESIVAHEIRSFICAPLWNQNDVTGILYVDNPRSKSFAEADLDLCVALSNYAAVAIEQARLSARVLEESRRRERLQRYHSPAVVSRILDGGVDADAPFIAQERDVTVLFVDIVGFTSMAQSMSPPQVARLLNAYFGRMADVIFEFGGMLDKFIGDGILAVFGAPFDQPDHAIRAIRSALAMRQALTELNIDQLDRQIRVRFGINTGMAMVSDVGSSLRREFTVLGDVVNTASRIESQVAGPGEIVIGPETHERVRGGEVHVRSRGPVTLRGCEQQIEVFEVQG